MNAQNKILFSMSVFIILILFIRVYKINEIVNIEEIEMSMVYDGSTITGFDVNKTALTFGKIPLGSTSKRSFVVSNDYNFPIKVKIKKEGNIAKFIHFSEDDFILDIEEEKEISILAIPEENMEHKEYHGILKVMSIR